MCLALACLLQVTHSYYTSTLLMLLYQTDKYFLPLPSCVTCVSADCPTFIFHRTYRYEGYMRATVLIELSYPYRTARRASLLTARHSFSTRPTVTTAL